MSTSRRYDLILLGATGYTGKLCAEHVTKHLPTNLQWAVAGRSSGKLQSIVDDLKTLNPNRIQPDVLPVNLNKAELVTLAQRTRVLLNCVGPYHLYSTPVVAACAENGTHYLDVTGETPWVREILHKYNETAKSNRAILIPEIGVESAPSDLMGYMLASTVRKAFNCGVRDVICALHEMKNARPSGGTLATALGLLDHYSLAELRASFNPFVLSTATAQQQAKIHPSPRSFLSRALGPFSNPDLGILTTSLQASPNEAIVHRSSSLMPQLYGTEFRFSEYLKVSSYAMGILVHFALIIATLFISIKPIRSLIRKFIYQPGQGPTAEAEATAALEYRATATATASENNNATTGGEQTPAKAKAKARFRFDGGMYHLTAVLVTEGAMVLVGNPDLVDRLAGGLLTPACLGDKYVERLQAVGVQIEAGVLS